MSITNNSSHLCDACGARTENDRWYCNKCHAHFCNKCGKHFAYQQGKTNDPFCPACWVELQLLKDPQIITLQPISDEQKVLNYIRSSRLREIRNKKDLFYRLSRLLNEDQEYVEDVWSKLEKRNPSFINQIVSKFKDEVLRQHYQRMQVEALHPKSTPKSDNFSEEQPSEISSDKKVSNIKDLKSIDGLEIEWKDGKLRPADQKSYRSKFDEQ